MDPRPAPPPVARARRGRAALVAGAVGRLGEAMLARALSGGEYAQVVALADAPMTLGIARLALATPETLPPIDDVFVLLSEPGVPGTRSFHGRDAPFVQVDRDNALVVARAARAAGATRLLLIAPMPAWQQVGLLHRGLGDPLELELARLPFARLTVLRPVRESGRRAAGFVERIASVYISLQLLMLPRSIEVLTSEQIARCALAAMRQPGEGVSVVGADGMRTLLDAST